MMGNRQRLKNGNEIDAILARHYYKYLARAGKAKSVKVKLAKRRRYEAKQELKERQEHDITR